MLRINENYDKLIKEFINCSLRILKYNNQIYKERTDFYLFSQIWTHYNKVSSCDNRERYYHTRYLIEAYIDLVNVFKYPNYQYALEISNINSPPYLLLSYPIKRQNNKIKELEQRGIIYESYKEYLEETKGGKKYISFGKKFNYAKSNEKDDFLKDNFLKDAHCKYSKNFCLNLRILYSNYSPSVHPNVFINEKLSQEDEIELQRDTLKLDLDLFTKAYELILKICNNGRHPDLGCSDCCSSVTYDNGDYKHDCEECYNKCIEKFNIFIENGLICEMD